MKPAASTAPWAGCDAMNFVAVDGARRKIATVGRRTRLFELLTGAQTSSYDVFSSSRELVREEHDYRRVARR